MQLALGALLTWEGLFECFDTGTLHFSLKATLSLFDRSFMKGSNRMLTLYPPFSLFFISSGTSNREPEGDDYIETKSLLLFTQSMAFTLFFFEEISEDNCYGADRYNHKTTVPAKTDSGIKKTLHHHQSLFW